VTDRKRESGREGEREAGDKERECGTDKGGPEGGWYLKQRRWRFAHPVPRGAEEKSRARAGDRDRARAKGAETARDAQRQREGQER